MSPHKDLAIARECDTPPERWLGTARVQYEDGNDQHEERRRRPDRPVSH